MRELDAALDRGDVAAAAELAERGELLRGFEDEWALAARDERRDRLGAALAARAGDATDPAAAIEWARRRARLDPLSEGAVRGLMAAFVAAGDRGAALAAYERFSERLRRELRVAPSRDTRELAATLRTDAPPGAAGVPVGRPASRRRANRARRSAQAASARRPQRRAGGARRRVGCGAGGVGRRGRARR